LNRWQKRDRRQEGGKVDSPKAFQKIVEEIHSFIS